MKYLENLKELMTTQLRTLYLGDLQLEKLLHEFIDETADPTLKKALTRYAGQMEDQVIIVRRVFNDLFEQKRGGDCSTIIAMAEEARSHLINASGNEMKDALRILYTQYIIHQKIVLLGAVCTYGKLMGFYEDVEILHEELEREKRMDRDLAMIAESIVDLKVPQ